MTQLTTIGAMVLLSAAPGILFGGECSVTRLSAKLGDTAESSGHRLLAVVVTNSSGGACTVQGAPDVRFLDARAKDLNINETKNTGSALSLPLKAARVKLGTGESATFFVAINTVPGKNEVCPETAQLGIHLKEGHKPSFTVDAKVQPCLGVDILPFVPGSVKPSELAPYQIKPYVR